MNVLAHYRKIVRLIECNGVPLFPDEHREEVSESSASQFRINSLLGITNAQFLKYFKNEPGGLDVDETQARINRMLSIDPLTFSKYFK